MIDTRQVGGANPGDVSPVTSVAQVRERIEELGGSIIELHQEAERLLASARARTVVALLDPPRLHRADVERHSGDQGDDAFAFGAMVTPADAESSAEVSAVSAREEDDDLPGAAAHASTPSEPVHAGPDQDAGTSGEVADTRDTDTSAAPAVPAQFQAPELPVDWAIADSDDNDALEKFFSSDVEPEPARRWLLTD